MARKNKKHFGDYDVQQIEQYSDHANEIRALSSGQDFVELGDNRVLTDEQLEHRAPGFERRELAVIRNWVQRRPLEPTHIAAAMVPFPRTWNTVRGRYSRFRAPGAAGTYGLMRARASF